MPRIRLTQNELNTVVAMPADERDFYKALTHIYNHGFLFDYFTIVSEEGFSGYDLPIVGTVPKHTYKVKINGTMESQTIDVKIICEMRDKTTKHWTHTTTIEKWVNSIADTLHAAASAPVNKWDVNKPEVDILIPMMFMVYAVLKAMNREVIIIPETSRRYTPVSERKTSKPKDEYRLFEVIRKYSRHINHNKHNITCESWQVKGHFRHYKNGKVTYVKPYIKGKGTPKDHDYRI